jgi:putative lipoic acid-binding regulatory protein
MTAAPESSESALGLIDYPSKFPLKVFGKPSAEFEATVVDLVRARVPQAEHIEISRRSSKGGKYLALTLTFTVHTQQQLEDIYSDLHACEQVMMSL